jgi:type II secretory pathway component PulK
MEGEAQLRTADRRGIAMLSALGVLVILGLLSNAFSAHMRLAYAYAMRDAQDLKAQYLAVAGIQDAIARLKVDSPMVDAYVDTWWPGHTPELAPLGKGGYTLRVEDESARINVLEVSAQMLGAVLGGDKEALAAVVQYRSSNRLFTIEDLGGASLGADPLSRLIALGTTLGDGKININTAHADVIAALPGMDANAAQMVMEFRAGTDGVEGTNDDFVFAVPEDLAKVPGLTQLRTAPAIPLVKVNTNIFRIESTGSVLKGTRTISSKRITAVLRRDNNKNINIMSWEDS